MIDVPVEVKDALREGTYKKNYRFVVGEEEWHEVGNIETIGRYSPSIHYDDDKMFTIRDTKTYRFIVDDDEHDTYTLYYYKSSDPNWRTLEPISRNTWEFTNDAYSAYVEINSSSGNLYSPVSVQNYYAETIDNNNLVSESVSIDERMCSGDTLKFGLCEGSSLEFQYFNKPNITGKRVQAFVDVEYGADEPYTIPMGFFDVKKCSRQASTGIIKATCYNKLQSDYLDAEVNEQIIEIAAQGEAGADDVSFFYLLRQLLAGYSIETYNVAYEWPDITDAMLEHDDLFLDYWMPWHGARVSELYFPIYTTSSGAGYLHIAYVGMGMGAVQGTPEGTSSYYTRFLFNLNAAEYITQTIYTALGNTNLDNRYVRGHEDHSARMSLREFLLEGGFLEFWADATYSYSIEDQNEVVGGRIKEQTTSTYITPLQADYLTDVNYISVDSNVDLWLPYKAVITNNTTSVATNADFMACFRQMHGAVDWVYKGYNLELPTLALQRITEAQAEALSKVTLRDLQTSVYESVCQFGQLSRTTDLFSGVELNHSRLYPADSLYPATNLYPDGAALSGFKSMYSKLWADEGNIHKWRYLIITYKGLNGDNQEEDFTLQRTVNNDGTDDYNMSDNWLFRNLVWTSEQVAEYAEAMVAKMQDMTWFPFEMWCAGLPYLETGDEIEIPLNGESYTSYVLQRQLKGIQNLQDTYINGTLDIF